MQGFERALRHGEHPNPVCVPRVGGFSVHPLDPQKCLECGQSGPTTRRNSRRIRRTNRRRIACHFMRLGERSLVARRRCHGSGRVRADAPTGRDPGVRIPVAPFNALEGYGEFVDHVRAGRIASGLNAGNRRVLNRIHRVIGRFTPQSERERHGSDVGTAGAVRIQVGRSPVQGLGKSERRQAVAGLGNRLLERKDVDLAFVSLRR